MFRKRVVKTLISFILVFGIMVSCSFSVFARRSFFEVDSRDWITSNQNIYRAVYPERISRFPFIDEVYSHISLNDSAYVVSSNWYDYTYTEEIEFYFPEFPFDSDSIIFRYGDHYLMFTGFDSEHVIPVYNSDEGYFAFRNLISEYYEFSLYSLSYPFDEWVHLSDVVLDVGATNTFFENSISRELEYFWSSCDVPDFLDLDDVIYSAGDYSEVSSSQIHSIDIQDLYVTSGALYFQIPSDIVHSLADKDSCFVFEDFGYVCAANTSFINFRYGLSFRINGEYMSSGTFLNYKYLGFVNDEFHEPGFSDIFDHAEDIDFSELTVPSVPIDIIVTFTFVSDGYNLFFPGDFTILDYTEYVTDKNHHEIVDSISDSTEQIVDSIDDMNGNLEYLISGDIGVEQPDIDTSELDDVVSEQDQIVGDILASLDDNISDYVPAGYDSYGDYLIDNINSFKSEEFNNTFNFIRSTFDSLVASMSLLPLLLFSLSFGFAVFALGRRLR